MCWGVVERGWSGVLGCGREGVEWCVGVVERVGVMCWVW